MTLELWIFWLFMLFQLSIYIFIERKCLIIGPGFSFLLIWLTIVSWSFLPISNLSRNLSDQTIAFLGVVFTAYFIGYLVSFYFKKGKCHETKIACMVSDCTLLSIMSFLALLNIIVSGYVPLLNIIQGLDSDYVGFGIPTVYGLFNAYCNFIGMYFYYRYLICKESKYLVYIFMILFVFFMLVTRQNIITLIFECCVIHVLLKDTRRIVIKIFFSVLILLYAFSIIGEIRSGNIYEIAEVFPEYEWIPSPFIWLYSYSVFNLVNLDNLILLDYDPLYNFSSFSKLIPSFLRPEIHSGINYLEKINFNVSTYLSGLYTDLGILGTCLFSFLQGYFVNKYYLLMKDNDKLKLSFTILFICNLLSFFTNMFFYLPMIGQLFFVMILLKVKRNA